MPYSIELATGKTLPSWCGDSLGGQAFWVVVLWVSKHRRLDFLIFTLFLNALGCYHTFDLAKTIEEFEICKSFLYLLKLLPCAGHYH